MNVKNSKSLLRALGREILPRPPFWLMRQAGRYLPEYREVRAKAGSFLDLVYNPDLATEVTLQPLRRFGMDAAILFSDILTVPHALGRRVTFEGGEGPRLDPLRVGSPLPAFDPAAFDRVVQPVYDTVASIRGRLRQENFTDAALIGFAGAPWTIACYMIEGQGSRDFIGARAALAANSAWFLQLLDLIADATIHYLSRQIEAGAEVVQLFDSWAGALSADDYGFCCFSPTVRIANALRQRHPGVPVIGFPKGVGLTLPSYASGTGIQGLSIDYSVPLRWAVENLGGFVTLQGNLDPALLLAGGTAQDRAVDRILEEASATPFIFNLGHGVHKDTDPENVARLAERIHSWNR